MMQVYPSAPPTRRGPHPVIADWQCAECGLQKQVTGYSERRRKCCSDACANARRQKLLSGPLNHRYSGDKPKPHRRKWERVPTAKHKAIIAWIEARATTAEDMAQRLDIPKHVVHHVASHYRRKMREACA